MSVSRRQNRGLWTLCLLIVAESISHANAVGAYNAYQTHAQQRQNGGDGTAFARPENTEECETGEGAKTCGATAEPRPYSTPAKPMYPRARLQAKRIPPQPRTAADCCADCSNCMDESSLEKLCGIPRGGGAADTLTETLEAASGTASSHHHHLLPYGIPLNGWKVIFQAFLTALNVFCWLIPLRSKKITENKLALSLANAFSGGVFLTLAFGHLIPECIHGFEGYNEVTPFMIVLGGYLLIFFVEKVAFDTHDILHEMEQDGKASENGNGSVASVKNTGRSAVILLAALAVHSILEMMALGLADSFGDCAILTLSIALHQPAESIALLVAFLKSGMPKGEIIKFLSIFSAMGPIGVALGMAVNEFAAPIVDAIMLAVVAGTFVYVGATEVIPEEWEDSEHKWKKFAALMSGIVSIFFITQYTMTLEMD